MAIKDDIKQQQKLRSLIENITQSTEESINTAKKFVETWGSAKKETIEALAAQNEYLKNYSDLLTDAEKLAFVEAGSYEKLKQIVKEQEAGLKVREKILEEQRKQLVSQEELLRAENKLTEAQDKRLKKAFQALAAREKTHEIEKKVLKTQKDQVKASGEVQESHEKVKDSTREISFLGANWAKSLFGVGEQAKNVGEKLGERGVLGTSKLLLGSFRKQLTATSLIGSAYLKVFEIAKKGINYLKAAAVKHFGLATAFKTEYDAMDNFQKKAREVAQTSAAAFQEYQSTISAVASRTVYTRKEMTESYNELFRSSEVFRGAIGKEKEASIELAKTLERSTGVALANTQTAVQNLTLAFGKSLPQARKITAQFALTARTLKMDVNKAMSDFAAQTDNLAKFGLPDVENQFFRLAKVQELTGVSMNKMIGTMERFTTFEGALTAASKLNAVFGTTIDGMELMDVTMEQGPLAGFIKLRERMDEAGMKVDELNYAQFRVLQQNLGLTAEELRKLGSVSTEELAKIANKDPFMSTAGAMKELTKDTERVTTPTEKLADATDRVAKTLSGIVEWFRKTQEWIAKLISGFGWFGKLLTSIFISTGPILIGIGIFLLKLKFLKFAFGGVGKFAKAAGSMLFGFGKTLSTTTKTANSMRSSLGASAVGITHVGKAAPVAAGGLKTLGTSAAVTSRRMGMLKGAMFAVLPIIGMVIGQLMKLSEAELKTATTGQKAQHMLGSTAEYAAYGAMLGGAKGAVIGAGAGLVKSGIEADPFGTGKDDPGGFYNPQTGEYLGTQNPNLAAGQNFVSKPTLANVGELGPEMITNRTQRLLSPGSKVTPISSGGNTDLSLTVNLMTQDGKVVSAQNFNKTIANESRVKEVVAAYLDEKLNLIYG